MFLAAMDGEPVSPTTPDKVKNAKEAKDAADQLDLKNKLTFDYAHGANKVPKRQVTEDDTSE